MLFTPIRCPHHSHIHAIPYFLVGIICGPHRGSFPVQLGDHLRSNLGIISGPTWGSFAVQLGDHLRSNLGIICGPIWGSFAVQLGDHLRSNLGIICGPIWDHLRSNLGTICGPGSHAVWDDLRTRTCPPFSHCDYPSFVCTRKI